MYNLYKKQGVRKTQRMRVTSGEKVDDVKEEGKKRGFKEPDTAEQAFCLSTMSLGFGSLFKNWNIVALQWCVSLCCSAE